ncbi:hypothetical protein H0H87_000465 [Tephrocybe sp. NHM501043]|nr:hypothetical protein H0H87_000465 [Tephrocybe sp. NHM501043]
MNSKSPGQGFGLLEDDIEMNGLASGRRDHLPSSNHNEGHHYHDDENSDSEEDVDDALLGPQNRYKVQSRFVSSAGELWPQIRSIVIESAPTLLFTTIGLLFTGKLLDRVSHWPAMTQVHQLIMIIPVILNLKGNLEMNLSARLGTAANVGELDDPVLRRSIVSGNLSLLQVQAAVVSFIAAWIAVILGLMLPQQPGSIEPVPMANFVLESRRPIALPKDTYSTFSIQKCVDSSDFEIPPHPFAGL